MIIHDLEALATEADNAYKRGPEALLEFKNEEAKFAERLEECVIASVAADKDVSAIEARASDNRAQRDLKRTEKETRDDAARAAFATGDITFDQSAHAVRTAALAAEIQWCLQLDIYTLQILQPRARLIAKRTKGSLYYAGAEKLFTQALILAYARREALQHVVDVDNQAQIPTTGGKANDTWGQAHILVARGAECFTQADAEEAQINIRARGINGANSR